MSFRILILGVLSVVAAFCVSSLSVSPLAAAERKPNVVLLVADDKC